MTGNIVQGSPAIKEVLVAPPNQQAQYISRDIWNAATTAYSRGTATEAQKEILKWAHIITEQYRGGMPGEQEEINNCEY